MFKRAQPARLLAVSLSVTDSARLLILRRKEVVFGGADGSALKIADADVAQSHAVITRRRGRYVISDIKSTSGTFVNDKRVRRRRTLKHRDSIRFATGTVYRFIDPDAPLRRRHRRVTGGVLLLMICAFTGAAHFMKWDEDLPSLATMADFIAGDQERPNSNHLAAAQAASRGGASMHEASSTKTPEVTTSTPVAVTITTLKDPPASPMPSAPALAPLSWLDRLNYYRSLTGLVTLRDDRQLSASVMAHAHYVLVNFGPAIRDGNSLGVATHGEDPTKSGYTRSGSTAAENSQFAWGCGSLDLGKRMEQWIAGPFHRFDMLNPFLTQAGFGEASANGCWVAALRLPPPPEEVRPYPQAVEFPPDGATVSFGWQGIETPDPLTSCTDYKFPAGLPITLQLGRLQSTELSASSLIGDGKQIEHCAFDSHSYHNPNGDMQEYGRWALRSSGAIVLIPRTPLTRGTQYSVSIIAHGHSYAWKFKIAG